MIAAPRFFLSRYTLAVLLALAFFSHPSGSQAKVQPQEASGKKEQAIKIFEEFEAQRKLAAQGEECIRTKQCPSDESDFLRHIERAYGLQKQLESMAKKGNHEAAYLSGLIAFNESQRFLREFHAYMGKLDPGYYKAAEKFVALADRELARAKVLLLPPSKAMMPEACLLMGQVLESSPSKADRQSALTFFYCAAREWVLANNRDLAVRAYEGMLRNGNPQLPMMVDIHARLFNQRPDNPWRPMDTVSSDTAQSSVNR